MAISTESFLTGANIDFIEAQYARFLADPASVERAGGRCSSSLQTRRPATYHRRARAAPPPNGPRRARGGAGRGAMQPAVARWTRRSSPSACAATCWRSSTRSAAPARRSARGRPGPGEPRALHRGRAGHAGRRRSRAFDEPRVPLRRLIERMRRTYCGHIGVEFDAACTTPSGGAGCSSAWSGARTPPTSPPPSRRRILEMLTEAETFETTIHTRFQAAEALLGRGRRGAAADARRVPRGGRLAGPARGGVRHGAPRPAQRACNIMGKPADGDLQRVRRAPTTRRRS